MAPRRADVAFFTHVGVSMNVGILGDVLGSALLLFSIRLAMTALGSYAGGWWAGHPAHFCRLSWTVYVTQAGVALALIGEIKHRFADADGTPAPWTESLGTTLVAAIRALQRGQQHESVRLTRRSNACLFRVCVCMFVARRNA